MLLRSCAAGSVALLTALSLTACSSSPDTQAATPSPSIPGCPVTVTDPWVKAADAGMTAAFGVLANRGAEAVTITAANSPSAAMMELHEVVDSGGQSVMRPVAGGFVVPAGGSLTLEPGGYHMMLMGLPEPIEPGDDVDLTLVCSTGGSVTFTAQAKAFEGAGEDYVSPSPAMSADRAGSPGPASS